MSVCAVVDEERKETWTGTIFAALRRRCSPIAESSRDNGCAMSLPPGPPYYLFESPDEFRAALERAGFDGSSMTFKVHRIEWQVPTARFVFDAERNAGVRTAGLLARQTPEALDAIQAAIERGMRRYARGEGFAIPKAAYIVAVRKG